MAIDDIFIKGIAEVCSGIANALGVPLNMAGQSVKSPSVPYLHVELGDTSTQAIRTVSNISGNEVFLANNQQVKFALRMDNELAYTNATREKHPYYLKPLFMNLVFGDFMKNLCKKNEVGSICGRDFINRIARIGNTGYDLIVYNEVRFTGVYKKIMEEAKKITKIELTDEVTNDIIDVEPQGVIDGV